MLAKGGEAVPAYRFATFLFDYAVGDSSSHLSHAELFRRLGLKSPPRFKYQSASRKRLGLAKYSDSKMGTLAAALV